MANQLPLCRLWSAEFDDVVRQDCSLPRVATRLPLPPRCQAGGRLEGPFRTEAGERHPQRSGPELGKALTPRLSLPPFRRLRKPPLPDTTPSPRDSRAGSNLEVCFSFARNP